MPLLAEMPQNWVDELDRAANQVNEELAVKIADRIWASHPILGEALKDLLDNYRFDRIMYLNQSILG